MITVNIDEAKTRLEELLEKALNGETVTIQLPKGQTHIALLPLRSADFDPFRDDPSYADLYLPKIATRKLGSAKGQVWISDDFDAPLDEFKDYAE